MIRILPIAALLFGAACSQQDSGQAVTNSESGTAEAPAEAPSVPALEGEWRVAAVDGRPISGDSAMTAAFEGGKLRISSGCFRRAWAYTQERNVVALTVDPGGSANCGGGTPSGEQEAAYAVLTMANIAIFAKDGREASLSGTGGTLSLERR